MSLSLEGFIRPRLAEIKSDYDQRFTEALGPVNTNADAVIGQIIGIFSAALDDVWEAVQDTYDSMYPYSAEGTSLDGAVSFVGMTRLESSPTVVIAMCYGVEGTAINAGMRARASDNKQYIADQSIVIARSLAGDVDIIVGTVSNSTAYVIQLEGVNHSYTSDASATIAEILAGLLATINPLEYDAFITGEVLTIRHINNYSSFRVELDVKLTMQKLGSPCRFIGVVNGAHALPANALNVIDMSVVGWNGILNLVAGSTGTFTETDEELRLRHSLQGGVIGTATVLAIKSNLENKVAGVTLADVYENRLHTFDGLVPPHSIEAVVVGGLDQDVADKLFEVKPAGIETYGNVSLTVTDPNGDPQTCSFSRPVPVYIWVKVTVVSLYSEELLPAGIADAIETIVIDYVNSLQMGQDLIPQRFYGPIYAGTSGIGSLLVEIARTALEGDTPSYGVTTIAMARSEDSIINAARVTVLGV